MKTILKGRLVFPAQQFDVDSEVRDLNKDFRRRKRSLVRWVSVLFFGAFLIGSVFVMVWTFRLAVERSSIFYMLTSVVCAATIVPTLWVMRGIVVGTADAGNKDRKLSQRSVKKSMKVARELADAVPVLTRSHIDAGLRLDALMATLSPEWTAADVERVRAMLFADLSREEMITSLVEDRGLQNASQVAAALADMDALGKPLQTGWL